LATVCDEVESVTADPQRALAPPAETLEHVTVTAETGTVEQLVKWAAEACTLMLQLLRAEALNSA
jgi:hypothetical protein